MSKLLYIYVTIFPTSTLDFFETILSNVTFKWIISCFTQTTGPLMAIDISGFFFNLCQIYTFLGVHYYCRFIVVYAEYQYRRPLAKWPGKTVNRINTVSCREFAGGQIKFYNHHANNCSDMINVLKISFHRTIGCFNELVLFIWLLDRFVNNNKQRRNRS